MWLATGERGMLPAQERLKAETAPAHSLADAQGDGEMLLSKGGGSPKDGIAPRASEIQVIGGGLAGCEAAWQIARRGVSVNLVEMKPDQRTPAHHSPDFAELICSNSLKAARIESAAGLLKEEMRRLGSLLIRCADEAAVPAGGALAVDRGLFSAMVTRAILAHPKIRVSRGVCERLPDGEGPVTVVATGPLTAAALAADIRNRYGDSLRFYDAAAPIVTAESIDMDRCFVSSRYDRGEADYINCPMNREAYEAFARALVTAERAPLHDVDVQNPKVYEGCMPIEILMQREINAPRFGPMKPVGLVDPRTGHRPWAVVQLRTENREKSLYNLVGFQTNLRFPEQRRVFAMIPGLARAEFVRYGVMHRNTFLNSPKLLNPSYGVKTQPNLFFAGQITGVEGYMESASSGLLAGINSVRFLLGEEALVLPEVTMMGALSRYISGYSGKNFQPMGANFGILPGMDPPIRDKRLRYAALSERSLAALGTTA